jgi:hypothetical protein
MIVLAPAIREITAFGIRPRLKTIASVKIGIIAIDENKETHAGKRPQFVISLCVQVAQQKMFCSGENETRLVVIVLFDL